VKNQFEIGIEVIKVLVLAGFLYFAFNDAHFPNVLWKPAIALFKAGIIVSAYLVGFWFGHSYEEPWKSYLFVFYAVGILTLLSWAGLGTSSENGDPLFGGGEIVQEFLPSHGEMDDHALTIFLSLFIPAIYGVYKSRKKI
jgi:hypothetical protein